jgi:putative transposase
VKKSKFSEEQIVAALKRIEAGGKVGEVARQMKVSEATVYQWKAKYAGMAASDLKRLRELESEHARLKRMYAELSMAHHALQDVVQKEL